MKPHRIILVVLVTWGLGILGLPAPAVGQTIYSPYAITTMSTTGSLGAPLYVLYPVDVCVYQDTNIYIACYNDYTIRKLSTTNGINWNISLFAGAPNANGSTDGVGAAARFTYPVSVVTDSQGNVFVADQGNFTIRKITPAGEVTTFAGKAGEHGYTNGPGNLARFAGTTSLACDTNDNLYVCDYGNNKIRKITPGGNVSTFAVAATMSAEFGGSLAVDTAGNVFHASSTLSTIRKITPGGAITTIAGVPLTPGYVDSTNSAARFDVPNDIAVDALGNLYVTEAGSNTIRKITPVGNDWVVRTMAGSPGVADDDNGTGAAARFDNPSGIAVDSLGRLYITDFLNGLIRSGIYDGPTNDFNSWTNTSHGKWEGSNYWSVGTAPSVGDFINYITNAGTKAVLIDETTPVATLTVNNVLVSAPAGAINGLVLFNSGPAKPLQIKENLAIDSGGVVALTNGSLKVSLNLGVGIDQGAAVLDLHNGGTVVTKDGYVGYDDSGANAVSVNGPTSAWTNQSSFALGYYSFGNGMLVENGGTVVNQGTGVIGRGADNNAMVVTGGGSTFLNAGNLLIGADGGTGNSLTVVNGGAVHAGYAGGTEMRIGSGGDGNVMTVSGSGSVLHCSVPLRLVDNIGSATYNALYLGSEATVTTPALTVSNGNFVGLAGGTLNTGGTIINNGAVFPVGVGTEAATLRLTGGTHTFTSGLLVTDYGVLTGCGTINGPVTVAPGGTVRADCGTLIFSGPVTNNGTIQPLYGTNVIFQGLVINHGSILTNLGAALWTCPIVVTGAIVNLNDSATTTITDGTNSVQFNWSLAGPGASGYIYTTANTAIAAVTNVTSVSQITNATAYTFLNSGNVGPLKDAGANGGNAQFVLLRNKTTGHYCAVRMDDVQANGRLNASWWFQSQSGQTNFGCVPPPPPPGPQPAANFTMQASGGNPTLSFATQPDRAYTIQMRTNLMSGPWLSVTNFPGDGLPRTILISPSERPAAYYRILTQ